MEKRKAQRIIGILIVVALVIIALPFLFNKKELPPQEVSALTAPAEQQAFSTTTAEANQSTTTQSAASDSSLNTAATDNSSAPNAAVAPSSTANSSAQDNGITPIAPAEPNTQNQNVATPAAVSTNMSTDVDHSLAPSAQTSTTQATAGTNATMPTNVANTPATNNNAQPETFNAQSNVKYTGNTVEVTTPAAPTDNSESMQNTEEATPAVVNTVNDTAHSEVTAEKTTAIISSGVHEVKSTHSHSSLVTKKAHLSSKKDLANLKRPAWVVQMGSFKNKSNAHRLVDQLKTAGFKAFAHEVASSAGVTRTRVYIGPELKEASAHQLSTQVERKVKLRGLVVPYKPLAV